MIAKGLHLFTYNITYGEYVFGEERGKGMVEDRNGLISVALCTYNGELYISEQIQSILKQTLLPDEIIICDDGSTDSTLELLGKVSALSAIPIYIYKNEHNLGSTKNFEKAINLCKGDIIFLADQDDLWYENKIKIFKEFFINHPNVLAAFSNGDMIDARGNNLGYTLWDAFKLNAHKQARLNKGKALEVLLKHNVVTGAAMAFRSNYKKLIFPLPDLWIHDGWIVLMLSAVGEIKCIDQPLIRYRQHDKQQVGAVEPNLRHELRKVKETERSTYLLFARQYLLALERLLSFYSEVNNTEKMSLIADKVKHLLIRANIGRNLNRIIIIAKELVRLNYSRYSNGIRSFLKDLFLY